MIKTISLIFLVILNTKCQIPIYTDSFSGMNRSCGFVVNMAEMNVDLNFPIHRALNVRHSGFNQIMYPSSIEGPIRNSIKSYNKEYVTIYPIVYEKAFPNPLKGFRSSSIKSEDYPTLTRLYIKWNEIENSGNDGIEKILEYCNTRWQGLPGRNIKVIPRVYLEWPYNSQNADNTRDTVVSQYGNTRYCERYWPADMVKGDYSSAQFRERLIKLIYKLGKAWDNDPRVAYIEMGLIGWWGEQHSPSVTPEMQKLIGDAFKSAFRTKLVMIRHAKDFTSYSFGSYWDSFAHASQYYEAEALIAQGDKWKSTVRGGEVAYDWGDRSKTGSNPDESLKIKEHRDHIISFIRSVHCNHLGWINNYNTSDPEVFKGAEEIQKSLGYRFIIDAFSYTPVILKGDTLNIRFSVINTGSSPFYYNWPVELSLLDPMTKEKIWTAVIKDLDIRTWLPGDQWDTKQGKYIIQPVSNQIERSFSLPDDFHQGEYIVCLSVLDPAGNIPSLRFAISNYFNGGLHPMGIIGVGKKPSSFQLREKEFDDLYKDRTLYYLPDFAISSAFVVM